MFRHQSSPDRYRGKKDGSSGRGEGQSKDGNSDNNNRSTISSIGSNLSTNNSDTSYQSCNTDGSDRHTCRLHGKKKIKKPVISRSEIDDVSSDTDSSSSFANHGRRSYDKNSQKEKNKQKKIQKNKIQILGKTFFLKNNKNHSKTKKLKKLDKRVVYDEEESNEEESDNDNDISLRNITPTYAKPSFMINKSLDLDENEYIEDDVKEEELGPGYPTRSLEKEKFHPNAAADKIFLKVHQFYKKKRLPVPLYAVIACYQDLEENEVMTMVRLIYTNPFLWTAIVDLNRISNMLDLDIGTLGATYNQSTLDKFRKKYPNLGKKIVHSNILDVIDNKDIVEDEDNNTNIEQIPYEKVLKEEKNDQPQRQNKFNWHAISLKNISNKENVNRQDTKNQVFQNNLFSSNHKQQQQIQQHYMDNIAQHNMQIQQQQYNLQQQQLASMMQNQMNNNNITNGNYWSSQLGQSYHGYTQNLNNFQPQQNYQHQQHNNMNYCYNYPNNNVQNYNANLMTPNFYHNPIRMENTNNINSLSQNNNLSIVKYENEHEKSSTL